MKLWDYLSMYRGMVDLDVPDTEIDNAITVSFDSDTKDEIDKEFPYMDKFTQLLYKKLDIAYFVPDGIPVCNFSKIINENLELFKQHVKKHWTEECQWVLQQDAIDAGEFVYEFIKEFGSVVGGRYGESVNKQYYNLLKKCKE